MTTITENRDLGTGHPIFSLIKEFIDLLEIIRNLAHKVEAAEQKEIKDNLIEMGKLYSERANKVFKYAIFDRDLTNEEVYLLNYFVYQ